MGYLSYMRAAYHGYRLVGHGVLTSAFLAIRLTWDARCRRPTGGY